MTINALFVQSNPARRRYGVATLVGFATGDYVGVCEMGGLKFPYRHERLPMAALSLIRPICFYVIILASIQPRRCIRSQNILLIQ